MTGVGRGLGQSIHAANASVRKSTPHVGNQRASTNTLLPHAGHMTEFAGAVGSLWSKSTQHFHVMLEHKNTVSLVRSIEEDLEADHVANKNIPGHWLLDSKAFKYPVVFCVLANCVTMGMEADAPDLAVWATCEKIFTLVFFSEMIVKLAVLGSSYFRDRWNMLDFFLVWLAVVDFVINLVYQGAQLPGFSILRVLRLFRLARVLRLVRQFERLVLVIQGVTEALQATFWVALVLLLAIYVAAVFCVSYLGSPGDGTYPGYTEVVEEIDSTDLMVEYNPFVCFGNMSRAMLTLFNLAILAEWSEVVRPLMIKQPEFVFFFIFFVMFVTFGIMNVIIGMIVDSVMNNARQMQEEKFENEINKKKLVLRDLQQAVSTLDTSEDGTIDLQELEAGLVNKETGLMSLLSDATLKLPKGFTAHELLCMLDDDGDYILGHEEFVQSFYRLIDGGQFQQTCMIQMGINALKRLAKDSIHQTHDSLNALKQQHAHSDRRLARIEASLRRLEGPSEAQDMSELPAPFEHDNVQGSSIQKTQTLGRQKAKELGRHKAQCASVGAANTRLRAMRQLSGSQTLSKPLKPPTTRGSGARPSEMTIAARQPAGGVVQPLQTAPPVPAREPSEGACHSAPTQKPHHSDSRHSTDAPQPTSVLDSSSGSESDEVVIAWRPEVADSAKPDGYDVAVPALRLPCLGVKAKRPTSALSVR